MFIIINLSLLIFIQLVNSDRCFKDIPIYRSNSPYIFEKKGDLICIDGEQNTNKDFTYYDQIINEKIDSKTFSRSVNIDNSVSSALGTPINITQYQVGTSIFQYIRTTTSATYYSLPIKGFNSPICSGFQPITYMNDFTSTCSQRVTDDTCVNALDNSKYVTANGFCLITNLTTLAAATSPGNICCSTTTGTPTALNTGSSCDNALETLTLTISYSNPDGIVDCTVVVSSSPSVSVNSLLSQTFTVKFVQSGSTSSSASRSGNPGYKHGTSIISGILNGNSITTSTFGIIQPTSDGTCSPTESIPIVFGQNLRSVCTFSSISETCPNIANAPNIFMQFNSLNLYVAAYGNSNPTNITGWLPVTFCTSEIGSSSDPVCQPSSVLAVSTGQCYTRLDIQIAYANIGSVTNPQPILGAVVFHYQRVVPTTTSTLPTPLLITQSVTFQDISNIPAIGGDRLPQPNTRLPGDFFYPFSLSKGTKLMTFSLLFNMSIIFLFILM